MVPWIKMRTNLRDDPRVRLVAKRTGCNAVSVIGGLYLLWSLGDQYSLDGRLAGYTADDLDRLFGKSGFASSLAAEDVQWLEIEPEALIIPRFNEHNGASAKARSQSAKRVQSHRNRNADVTDETLQKREQMKRKNKKNTTATTVAAAPKRIHVNSPDKAVDPNSMDLPPSEEKKVPAWPASDFHALVAHFRSRWEERYPGVEFVFAEKGEKGRNGAQFRWVLDHAKGLERAKASVDAYLADANPAIVQERHPVGWLVSGWNKYQAPAAGATRKPKVLEGTKVYAIP